MTDTSDGPAAARPVGTVDAPSFEEALAALAEVVARLESGSLGLSASIEAYERGVALLRRLHDELASVEARVEQLVRIDDEGRPILAPVPAAVPPPPSTGAADSPHSPQARTTRGGSGGRGRRLPGMDEPAAGP